MAIRFRGTALVATLLLTLAATGCGSGDDNAAQNSDAAGGGGSAPQETTQVNFTVFPGAMPSMGVYVADALGFFEDEGLEVEYVNVGTGSSALQVLAAGETDFAISDVTGTATARAAGSDIVFASGQFTRFAGQLACRDSLEVEDAEYPGSMEALVGAKIGITAPGSSTDFYVRYSMLEAGVDPAEAEIIPIGGIPQLLAALQSGNVDCITAYQPMQQQLTGTQTLVDWQEGEGPDTYDTYSYNGIVTTESFAAENPDAVTAVNRAMKAAAEYASDESNAGEIAEKTLQFFQGIEVDALTEVTEQLAGTFGADITAEQIENAATVYEEVTGKPLGATYEELVAEPVRK